MAIKHGQILTVGNSFVVDRIQTGGPGNLNIPEEKIHELGNFNAVSTIRGIPDLSYDLESLDVTTDTEALLLRKNPDNLRAHRTDTVGTTSGSDVATDVSIVAGDLGRPIPTGTTGIPNGSYVGTVTPGVSFLISSSPTSQVNVNATTTGSRSVTFGGDVIDFNFSIPLDVISPFKASQQPPLYNIVSGIAIPWLTLENVTYRFGVSTFHVLAVCWVNTDGTSGRLYHGADYTDTSTTLTLVTPTVVPSTARVCVIYGSSTAASYPQSVNADDTVKPAALRSKDIDLYIGPVGGSLSRWTSVQSFEATRRVNLQNDEEFGNPHYVAQDYDTADVNGNVVIRPRDPLELIAKVQEIADVGSTAVAGVGSQTPVQLEARLRHPDTGAILKTIYVPDARFTMPAFQGRVNQRHDVTIPYSSDAGLIYVYKGQRVA
jgi:hypothetical protein